MHAWSTSLLLLQHSVFMLSAVKMLLKGEVGGYALNSHGNYIVRVCSHLVFAWIHCTDVRIHCTDILIECR